MNHSSIQKGDQQGHIVIFKTEDGKISVDARFSQETVWLNLDQMSELFERDKSTISRHIKNVFEEGELERESVVADFATTAADGKNYLVAYYNLDVIISVIKGFTMDDERLKHGGGRYFRELLQRVRDIRSSERNLYQQVTDIYATAIDYDPKAEITRQFFACVQNKMHYAAHQHTAAEVIYERADAEKPFVGMTNFKGNYVTREDVVIAKNYLSEKELTILNLLVSQYLDYAELQALEENAMTMQDWINTLDRILANNGRVLLTGKGSVSHQQAVKKAEYEFEIYRTREMKELESDFDRAIKQIKGIDQ